MYRSQIFFAFTFIILLPAMLVAQKSYIRGSVFDQKTGETLPGVTVFLEGTTIGTLTDFDGNFSLSVEGGTYELRLSYISYETKRIQNLVVKPGATVVLDNLMLSEAQVQLSEVVVTAEAVRNTESALITLKQKSANLIDGISASGFRKMGDSDAASSLKRVTGISVEGGKYVYVRGLGDRYTKTMLNGMDIPGLDPDRNTLQMDIFPTNVIDNIIVLKTFTPELPADFTGGVIDIATKDFPEVKKATITFSAGYNPDMHFNSKFLTYEGGKTDWLGFDDGSRAIPATENIPFFSEAVVNQNGEKGLRFKEILGKFNPTMAAQRGQSLMDYSAGFSVGNQIPVKKATIGYNLSLSYKSNTEYYSNVEYGSYGLDSDINTFELDRREFTTGDYGTKSVLLGGLGGLALKTEKSKFMLNFLHLQNGESKAAVFDFSGTDQGSNFDALQHNLEYSQRSLTNVLLSGKHFFGNNKWDVEWKISPTKSSMSDPDVRFTRYEKRGESFSISTEVGFPERIWRALSETNIGGQLNLNYNIKAFGSNAKLKAGGAYTAKSRDYEIRSFAINVRGIPLTGNPDELFAPENLWPYNGNVNKGTTYEARFVPNNSNQYQANNNNTAFYISAEFTPFATLKTIIGIRAEKFSQYYTGSNQLQTIVLDNEKMIDDLDFFPSLNFIYALRENQNLRLSYSRTIARPSFKELSYAEIYDPISGRTYVGGLFRDADDVAGIEYWDGKLIVSHIDNADLRWELMQQKGQTFSLSAFYKSFKNPIEIVQFATQKGTFQPRNVGDGRVLGLELEVRKNLGFLSSGLNMLSFSSNITFAESRIRLSETEYASRLKYARSGEEVLDYRSMAGQAPFIINAGITWDGGEKGFFNGLEAGFYYNVQGRTLMYAGINDSPGVYSSPFHSLNFNANKRFGKDKRISAGLKVENILNSSKTPVFESFKAVDQYFERLSPGRTITVRFGFDIF